MRVRRLSRQVASGQLNIAAHNLLRRVARGVGLDVVRADYYSPVVDTRRLASAVWERPAPMPGLDLDLEGQLRLIEERLLPFIAEFRPPLRPPGDSTHFYLGNPWYGPMDAHILYAMVRDVRPGRVLELGSGFSTLVIARALQANSASGRPGRHRVVDPEPSQLVLPLAGHLEIRAQSAANAEMELFTELQAGDVLFVDTTHVIRPGGEVTRLVLEVLPRLASGVVVHFHDIFRPFEYPRILYDHFNVHWQEHYLVQSFLAYNPNFKVLCSNHALWRLRRQRIAPLFPDLLDWMQPSAFWIVATT